MPATTQLSTEKYTDEMEEQTSSAYATPSGLTNLASASPILTLAEEAMPGGAGLVLLFAAVSLAIIIHSWGSSAASGAMTAEKARAAAETHKRRRSPECALARLPDGSKDKWDSVWQRDLLPHRYEALRKGETDPPNLPEEEGGLDCVEEDGIFACAGCGQHLYDNDFRFEAGCGWPCFYTCLENAVRERQDADGTRMELICNACNGHLGHIFRGEHWDLPAPGERHCVNSRSLRFIPLVETDGDGHDGSGGAAIANQ